MTYIARNRCWSWDGFILGLLAVSVALSLLPEGPWLYPLDALAVALLAAGAVRSARSLRLDR